MMHELLSCDTLAVAADRSACHSHMMAKNSDRPIGEAQPLQWFPPSNHEAGEKLEITGMEIPQVSHTYGVLGSKPYWMYGFEMGVNDQGVVVGNEAENSRDKDCEKTEGILGMDLLRLGLERGATAREALDVNVALLEEYGQLRNASALYQSHYENSFIIMDPREIWILETAGRRYAASRVKSGVCNIGNCYTLEKDIELASPDLEAHAREEEWLLPDEEFNFSKAYMKDFAAQTLAIPRWRRVRQLSQEKKIHDLDSLKRIFRDHYEDDPVLQPRYGASIGYLPTVCRHALQWDMSQTASSMIAWYQEGLGVVVREAYSQPCCSLYLPAYPGVPMPAKMSFAEETFSEDSLWWQMDRLAKIIGIDYDRFAPDVQEKAKKIEAEIEAMASAAEKQAVGAENAEKKQILSKVMEDSSAIAERFACEEYGRIKEELHAIGVRELCGPRAEFLKKYAEVTKMDIL